MDYLNINGRVYSRDALTPPVINSSMALQFGIKVPCTLEPSQFAGPNVGGNVKLRLVVDAGVRKMTCHAKVDWIEKDPDSGLCSVGFGSLSLTDEEFRVLAANFTEQPQHLLEFVERIRDKAKDAETVRVSDQAHEIMRLKAVNFPVSVIEAIDENRGTMPFSEFVTHAVREYLKRQ